MSPRAEGANGKESAPPAEVELPDLGRLRIERRPTDARRRRGIPWVGIALVFAVGCAAYLFREPLLALLDRGGDRQVEIHLVQRVDARLGRPGDVTANGYVVAERTASLASPLSGRLVHLGVDVGDRVAENQVVARLFAEDLEAARDEAKALHASVATDVALARAGAATAAEAKLEAEAVRAAEALGGAMLEADIAARKAEAAAAAAEAERLAREVARRRPLLEAERIDRSTFERLVSEHATAQAREEATRQAAMRASAQHAAWTAQVARALAGVATSEARAAEARAAVEVAAGRLEPAAHRLAQAEVMLEKASIRAPFAGLVVRKDAEVGEVIAPMAAGNSRGSVITLVDPKSFTMQVELNERRLLEVREGAPATIYLDAEPERGLGARVSKVWPVADRSKGTIEIRVGFTDPPTHLRPDMAGRVVFHAFESADAATEVPFVGVLPDVLVREGAAAFVWVVRADQTLERRSLEVGAVRLGHVEVLRGLEPGERVVRKPAADLSPGQRVVGAAPVGGSR